MNEGTILAGCAETVDARGLRCPLPLLKTKKTLARLAVGERVGLRADDPNTLRDVTAYAAEAGHRVISAETDLGCVVIVLEKGAAGA